LESIVKRYCNVTSFPPFASNDALLDRPSSVAATRNRVKNISEIRFSLRRRGEQRLAFAHVPLRAHRPVESERRPPLLVTADAVKGMKPGSVVVDIAAEAGGNCELTEPGKVVIKYGVQIHGVTNPAGMVPAVSSELFAKNLTNLLALLVKDGELAVNFEDEIVVGSCITRDGEIVQEATRKVMGEKVAAK